MIINIFRLNGFSWVDRNQVSLQCYLKLKPFDHVSHIFIKLCSGVRCQIIESSNFGNFPICMQMCLIRLSKSVRAIKFHASTQIQLITPLWRFIWWKYRGQCLSVMECDLYFVDILGRFVKMTGQSESCLEKGTFWSWDWNRISPDAGVVVSTSEKWFRGQPLDKSKELVKICFCYFEEGQTFFLNFFFILSVLRFVSSPFLSFFSKRMWVLTSLCNS